jgi:hypothetical protein
MVPVEYGIFDDEGLLEGDFWSEEEAQRRLDEAYTEDDAHVALVCPHHPEQEGVSCELCYAAEEDENEEDEPA